MTSNGAPRRRHGRGSALIVAVLVAVVAAVAVVAVVWTTRPANAPQADRRSGGCVVTAELVNPCRPWLGATANDYPGAADGTVAQILDHEKRIGRKLDIVHTYHGAGSDSLSGIDRYFAKRPSTILFTNWKPTNKWSRADGSDPAITAGIDRMAASVKSLGDHKILMTIAHEPENDLTGDPDCPNVQYAGHSGTPAQYRAMWAFVEQRFQAADVHNVVWVMDYNNVAKWDCVVPDVWPGNDLVDWVMFDAYTGYSGDFVTNVQRFQNLLISDTNASHAYTSKPWGIAEWGMADGDAMAQRGYIDQARASLDENLLPRIRAYIVYDSNNGTGGTTNAFNLRVGFDNNGKPDAAKQRAYDAFANDPRLTGSFTLPGQPPGP